MGSPVESPRKDHVPEVMCVIWLSDSGETSDFVFFCFGGSS